MLTLTALVAALLLSINATPWAGVWLYGCWVFLINAITPGTYILLPKAVGHYFGRENITFNYGLLFTSFVLRAITLTNNCMKVTYNFLKSS